MSRWTDMGRFRFKALAKADQPPCAVRRARRDKRLRGEGFTAGAKAAAGVAAGYNATSSHPYRIDDCILIKMNVKCGTPRLNRAKQPRTDDTWLCGFATGLAEMHRRLIGGADSTGVCEVARNAGLTIARAKAAGVSSFDLRELKKAGVR